MTFEKPQTGVTTDKATGVLNLGCGPEPENINLKGVQQALENLLMTPPDKLISICDIDRAIFTGAIFYWRYASELAREELRQKAGVLALTSHWKNGHHHFTKLRAKKLHTIFRERFQIELRIC